MKSKEELIKNYCKDFKIKFEEYNEIGFIGSYVSNIKAGNIESKMKTVVKKRIYQLFFYYNDNDIVMDKIIKQKFI